ncbi:MAG: tyrosine-type recombinase/integrase [Planctomycetota bacterium]|jgi:integrase/recombinase XerC
MAGFSTPAAAFAAYTRWVERQPLSANTRRTYCTQVRQFCAYLDETPSEYGDPLSDPHARDYAVRDYKAFLKTVKKRKPTTVNLALAAIDHFYNFLELGDAEVRREELPQQAPRGLEEEEQVAFLRAVERCPSTRDRAIATLLFYTGLRVGECSALDEGDVVMSARKGKVIVRSGKGDTYREVPLNADARRALKSWRKERQRSHADSESPAFFLNFQGNRLSVRAIDLLLRKLGEEANVSLSAHTLRHTCLTNLVRAGYDLVLVAEIAGHKRLETTRRYSLPTEQDRASAMESIRVEH